jgi:hypothetical protein
MTVQEEEVVKKFKSLVSEDSCRVVSLKRSKFASVAKLHIPDFLPKKLWKDGKKFVDKFFH